MAEPSPPPIPPSREHPTCLNCGATFGPHIPDDGPCDVWHPTTCTTCPEHTTEAADG